MRRLAAYALKELGYGFCEVLRTPSNIVCKFLLKLLEEVKPKEREIWSLTEVETKLGNALHFSADFGGLRKECYLIKDEYTGKWKEFGSPDLCQIARHILEENVSSLKFK